MFKKIKSLFTRKVSKSSVKGLKVSDDLMEHVKPKIMVKGQKFWLNDVLYQVKMVRGDGKVSLRVIGGKKGNDVVRDK